jgi:alkanesulfonate monooxygenase SsuD/methylene tetrahydromethanopterin reductase-like flavin-dependent oxidoreductase (luciferase family)
MKFILFLLPTIPATLAERKRLRPIASRTERWQRMIEEVVELVQLAEEVGFDAVAFPEHHLQSEGFEIGVRQNFCYTWLAYEAYSCWPRLCSSELGPVTPRHFQLRGWIS